MPEILPPINQPDEKVPRWIYLFWMVNNFTHLKIAYQLATLLNNPLSPSKTDLGDAFARADDLFRILPDIHAINTRDNILIPKIGYVVDGPDELTCSTNELRYWSNNVFNAYRFCIHALLSLN